jgi:hypothetical protein
VGAGEDGGQGVHARVASSGGVEQIAEGVAGSEVQGLGVKGAAEGVAGVGVCGRRKGEQLSAPGVSPLPQANGSVGVGEPPVGSAGNDVAGPAQAASSRPLSASAKASLKLGLLDW